MMSHKTESECPTKGLSGEAYLNSRREYWRTVALMNHKNSEQKDSFAKAKATATKSSKIGLTGEAYLNSRREFWHKEIAKDSLSCRKNTNQPKKKVYESKRISNILGVILGCTVLVFLGYVVASGGGPLLLLFALLVGAMLLKCM